MAGTPERRGLYAPDRRLSRDLPDDELILVNYEHHAVDLPYRMRFAIYVRKGEETYDKVDEVPEQLRCALAVRAFDANAMMVGWELVDGRDLEPAIGRLFANPDACTSTTRRRAATRRGWSGIERCVIPGGAKRRTEINGAAPTSRRLAIARRRRA